MTDIKGVSLIHLDEFIKVNHGEEGRKKILSLVSPEAGKAITKVNAAEWYPLAYLVEIEKVLMETFYNGDYSQARRVGQHDLEISAGIIYRIMLRFLNPAYLVKYGPKVWRALIKEGTFEVGDIEATSCIVRITDFNPIHEVFCHDTVGSITGGLVACGAKEIQVTHEACVLKGAPHCLFRCRWA